MLLAKCLYLAWAAKTLCIRCNVVVMTRLQMPWTKSNVAIPISAIPNSMSSSESVQYGFSISKIEHLKNSLRKTWKGR